MREVLYAQPLLISTNYLLLLYPPRQFLHSIPGYAANIWFMAMLRFGYFLRGGMVGMDKRQNIMLIRARWKRMWSQQEVAERVGVDKKTYSNWENCLQIPQPKWMRKLCEIFDKASPEELGYEQFNNSYRVRDIEVVEEGK